MQDIPRWKVLNIIHKAIHDKIYRKLWVMRKEEEKRDRSMTYLHHKGSDPGPLRMRSSSDLTQPASIISANIRFQTTGWRGYFYSISHVDFFFNFCFFVLSSLITVPVSFFLFLFHLDTSQSYLERETLKSEKCLYKIGL